MRIAFTPWAFLVLLGVVACHGDKASRTTFQKLGAAELVSAVDIDPSTKREVPMYYVLFVPDLDPPKLGGYGTMGGGGGTGDEVKIDYGYWDEARRLSSQPVYIRDCKTLQAGGRSFDLAQGIVFVADVSLNGAVTVTQVPPLGASHNASANTVLEHIKTSMPAHPRIQALKMPA